MSSAPVSSAAAERAGGDDPDAELAGGRDDLLLDHAREQRPLGLQGRDRVDGVGGAQRVRVHLGKPEVADLALLDELHHRAHALLDRHVRIAAVHVVEVDAVGAEPAQRVPSHASRIHSGLLSMLRTPPSRRDAELGGEVHLVAAVGDRAANQLLVVPRAVEV